MGQPGEKIDLSTFIAYLLPGLIVQFSIFALVDSMNLILNRKSLVPEIVSIDATRLIVLGAVLIVVGYFGGLIIDMYAHIFTGDYENARKNEAYQAVLKDLGKFIKDRKLKAILLGKSKDAGKERNTYIDAMYYHYATSDHWSRQNWSWSFYEASRNLVILFMPTIIISAFYLVVSITITFGIPLEVAIVISLVTSLVVSLITWRYPYRNLKGYRDTICRVYHRHRAYVVIGALTGQYTVNWKSKR